MPLGYRSINKTLQVVPEEAEMVRTIFARYLAVGSIRLLIEDLHQRGITPRVHRKVSREPNGQAEGGARFMVGPLGHILRNRFYVGEVVYKGEVHTGQHPPIVDPDTFKAVQRRLQEAAVRRTAKANNTTFLLAGRLYDDQGNRMTPSHTNKRGVRYRYYVSQAVLQNRMAHAGTIQRLSAPDIEQAVIQAVHRTLLAPGHLEQANMNGLPREEPSQEKLIPQLIAEHVVE